MGKPMESFLYGLISFVIAAGLIVLAGAVKRACVRLLEQADFR